MKLFTGRQSLQKTDQVCWFVSNEAVRIHQFRVKVVQHVIGHLGLCEKYGTTPRKRFAVACMSWNVFEYQLPSVEFSPGVPERRINIIHGPPSE